MFNLTEKQRRFIILSTSIVALIFGVIGSIRYLFHYKYTSPSYYWEISSVDLVLGFDFEALHIDHIFCFILTIVAPILMFVYLKKYYDKRENSILMPLSIFALAFENFATLCYTFASICNGYENYTDLFTGIIMTGVLTWFAISIITKKDYRIPLIITVILSIGVHFNELFKIEQYILLDYSFFAIMAPCLFVAKLSLLASICFTLIFNPGIEKTMIVILEEKSDTSMCYKDTNQNKASPEELLLILKEKYECGAISKEEYYEKREIIISNL